MAADVSSFAQREEGEGKRELVTRDLLGGGEVSLKSAEVDLELRVPDGWERRLDLVVSNLIVPLLAQSFTFGILAVFLLPPSKIDFLW